MSPHQSAATGAVAVALMIGLSAPRSLPAQTPGANDAVPAQDQRQQLQQVEAEKDQMRRRLAGFKLSEQEAKEQIDQLTEQVKSSRKHKRELEADWERAQQEEAGQSQDLSDLRLRMEGSRARIGVRVRRMYRFSKAEDSATLFQLARTRAFARDAYLLGKLQQADLAALKQFELLNAALTAKQRESRQSLERLRLLKADLDSERANLQERENGLKASLGELRHNQQLYAKYLSDLDRLQTGMQQALVRMEQSGSADPGAHALPEAAALRGHMAAPAPGTLVARFGQQDPRYQLKKFQRGVVIRVADESPVAAVAAGTVVHAGPFQGYQDLVVLDHGRGLYSVYGYLEHVAVAKGDQVGPGRVLGTASFQPEDNAFDLYFELRLDGKPEDPLTWMEPNALKAVPPRAGAPPTLAPKAPSPPVPDKGASASPGAGKNLSR